MSENHSGEDELVRTGVEKEQSLRLRQEGGEGECGRATQRHAEPDPRAGKEAAIPHKTDGRGSCPPPNMWDTSAPVRKGRRDGNL